MNLFWRDWGKARPVDDSAAGFHLLPFHCLDVAAVGVAYLNAAPDLRRWLASRLGISEQALVAWVGFWLCLHDLGKFSQAFQGQRAALVEQLQSLAPTRGYSERHDTLGRVAWTKVLEPVAIADQWLDPQTQDCGLKA